MSEPLKVFVPGSTGKMGLEIINRIKVSHDFQYVSSGPFDVLIDFTSPDGTIEHLNICLENNKPIVIGTTGFSSVHLMLIEEAAKSIPIILSANMSIGVNICYKLLAQAAKMTDSSWDISIDESHHIHKKDSPSGTAKHMAKILANSSEIDLDKILVTSKREGEIVGIHTVKFSTPDESFCVKHNATNRSIYANGALYAAKWLFDKKPGFYDMQDVINL